MKKYKKEVINFFHELLFLYFTELIRYRHYQPIHILLLGVDLPIRICSAIHISVYFIVNDPRVKAGRRFLLRVY